MDTYANHVAGYLFAQSWQIALLAVVAGSISYALRNRSAHVRYLLWLIVLAKCLVPPYLTIPLAVLPQESFTEPLPRLASPETQASGAVAPEASGPPRVEEIPRTPAPENLSLSAREAIVLVWLAGVLLFLAWVGCRAVRYTLWLRRRRKPLPPGLHQAFQGLFTGFRLSRPPRIWLTEDISQPFVWGLLRGSVYLPNGSSGFEDSQHNRTVLAHELSHIARFDAAVNVLQVLAQAIYWFHPFVWWMNRKMRQEREKCCDEMAVAQLNTLPEHYTGAIVEALATERRSAHRIPSLAIVGSVRDIEERIRTMMRPGRKFFRRPSLPAAVVVLLTAIFAVPTTVVLTVRAENQQPTASEDAEHIFGNPTNLGATVNNSVGEWNPHISPDGLSLYFTAFDRPGGLGDADIWLTKRNSKDEPWRTPVNLGPPVNTSHIDGGPCLSTDGLEMYFVSDRPGGSGSRDIWFTKRKTHDSPWGTPVNLGPIINSAVVDNEPSLSSDGLSLYFSDGRWSDARPGGLGRADIWMTTRKTRNDPWGRPVNLGPMVNTSDYDICPSISKDGLSLYFASRSGYGNLDIWVTTRKSKDDPWGRRVNLGPTVNTAQNESTPFISSDGSTLYFVSDRPGSQLMDIWHVSRESRAKSTKSLHEAAAHGDMDQVKTLLSTGVDLNEKDEQGITALHHAVINGHKGIADILIATRADVNASGGEKGWTPLHHATMHGSIEMVQSLVAQGADVNATNKGGETVLEAACWSGHADVAEFLIAKGADINAKDQWGFTPLQYAISNNEDTARLLIAKGADVNAKRDNGITPLHLAAMQGKRELAQLLIDKGADVNAKNKNGNRPLFLACVQGHRDMAELLIAKGAEINYRRVLRVAAQGRHRDLVELCIAEGADVSEFHFAAFVGDLIGLKRFVDGGTDVDIKDGELNRTPLSWAVSSGRKDVAGFLLAKGANVNARDRQGLTPLTLAVVAEDTEIAELLLAKGADINASTTGGYTPLHITASQDQRELAEFLLSKGADVNAKNKTGGTPLHRATGQGHKKMVDLLLANRADVNARDNRGRTPLALAKENGHTEIFELLRKHGAKESN